MEFPQSTWETITHSVVCHIILNPNLAMLIGANNKITKFYLISGLLFMRARDSEPHRICGLVIIVNHISRAYQIQLLI